MAIKLINDDVLQDIAEAIQGKDNGSKMTVDQMASRISLLSIGGGNTDIEDSFVTGTLNIYENSRVTTIGEGVFAYLPFLTSVSFPEVQQIERQAFYSCRVTSISFPKATSILDCTKIIEAGETWIQDTRMGAFQDCTLLASVNFPMVTTIGGKAFQNCYSLTSVSFPQATYIGDSAFKSCSKLASVSFPQVTNIGSGAFQSCFRLTSVILGGQQSQRGGIYPSTFQRCYNLTDLYLQGSYSYTLYNSNTFSSTPIGGYSASAGKYGSIYVPASLYDQYISATNWTYFSSRFVSV